MLSCGSNETTAGLRIAMAPLILNQRFGKRAMMCLSLPDLACWYTCNHVKCRYVRVDETGCSYAGAFINRDTRQHDAACADQSMSPHRHRCVDDAAILLWYRGIGHRAATVVVARRKNRAASGHCRKIAN